MPTTLTSMITTRKGTMKKLPNIHPGEILLEEFLKPPKITGYRLLKETHMPATRVRASAEPLHRCQAALLVKA